MPAEFASPFLPGELVVHTTHGLSRYMGTRLLEATDGTTSEYFQLDYAGGHRVFVPIEHVARLTRHAGGPDEALAKLNAEVQPRSPYSRAPKPQ